MKRRARFLVSAFLRNKWQNCLWVHSQEMNRHIIIWFSTSMRLIKHLVFDNSLQCMHWVIQHNLCTATNKDTVKYIIYVLMVNGFHCYEIQDQIQPYLVLNSGQWVFQKCSMHLLLLGQSCERSPQNGMHDLLLLAQSFGEFPKCHAPFGIETKSCHPQWGLKSCSLQTRGH